MNVSLNLKKNLELK